jgi:hypothetical protein
MISDIFHKKSMFKFMKNFYSRDTISCVPTNYRLLPPPPPEREELLEPELDLDDDDEDFCDDEGCADAEVPLEAFVEGVAD